MESEKDRVTHVTDGFDSNVTRTRAREGITKRSGTSVTQPEHRRPEPARQMMRPLPEQETEAIKRYGWRDQGVLVVRADDTRLTWPEREMVRQLGAKLYGPNGGRR
jgi:hypothetical protein